MLNFRSVSIKGAVNLARARVLWQDGSLKVFNALGLVLSTRSKEPTRSKGRIRAWDVDTDMGHLVMRGKCTTCGGRKWRRVTYMNDEELWNLL